MASPAATVSDYLAALPPERQHVITAVRQVILDHLDAGYAEGMQYGMIGYYVPHEVFPAGYHCDPRQPLPFAALAAQKSGFTLHLMGIYMGPSGDDSGETAESQWFRAAWLATGKKLDMGKSCVRFKKLADVPLEVVAEAIRRMPAASFIARYQQGLQQLASQKARSKPAVKVDK